jgi:putative tricarboxylic transport membrane protein
MKKLIHNGDVVSGGVLAGLGIYLMMEARAWDYMTPEGPGPGFFPMWYGIALALLSVVLAAQGARAAALGTGHSRVDWQAVGRAMMSWVALASCIALLKTLGFVVAFSLLTVFVVAVMYGRPIVTAVAAALGITGAFYLIFKVALQVELPAGVFGF